MRVALVRGCLPFHLSALEKAQTQHCVVIWQIPPCRGSIRDVGSPRGIWSGEVLCHTSGGTHGVRDSADPSEDHAMGEAFEESLDDRGNLKNAVRDTRPIC